MIIIISQYSADNVVVNLVHLRIRRFLDSSIVNLERARESSNILFSFFFLRVHWEKRIFDWILSVRRIFFFGNLRP